MSQRTGRRPTLLQPQTQEDLLDEDEPRERDQLAVLKTKLRKAVSLAVDVGSATLHRSGLLLGSYSFAKHIIPRSVGRFPEFSDHRISLQPVGLGETIQ